jgi:glycosyltransferase involved in cell wall biosynthesis
MTPTCILAFDLDAYVSGGQNSFIVLLRELASLEEYKILALCPRGALADAFSAAGIPHIATTRTLGAARLGGGQATIAVRDVVRSARTVNAVARACDVDLIHANSVRAGVVALIANLMGGPPVVVHVRDHFRASWTARLARAFVLFRAAGVIAVSQYTARRFELPGFQKVRPIHNAIDPLAFIPSGPRGSWRHRLGDETAGRVVIGVVAQLTPWKAQDDAIRGEGAYPHVGC